MPFDCFSSCSLLFYYYFYAFDTEAAFLDLNLSIHNDTVSTKIYDKPDDFDIVNFPFLDGVHRRPSYDVYFNLFALQGHLHTLMTSIIVTNP